jgi:hypothetical protein
MKCKHYNKSNGCKTHEAYGDYGCPPGASPECDVLPEIKTPQGIFLGEGKVMAWSHIPDTVSMRGCVLDLSRVEGKTGMLVFIPKEEK